MKAMAIRSKRQLSSRSAFGKHIILKKAVGLNGFAVGVAIVAGWAEQEYLYEGRDMGSGITPRMEIVR